MKHRYVLSFLAVAGVFGSTSAFAASDSGVDLGARLGYGIPMGDLAENLKLSDGISGQIPIWLDLGYRFTPNIMAGVYFQYGFGLMNSDNCKDCSGHDMRFGIQGQYRISPGENVDPWVGLGIGYEWLGISGTSTVTGTEVSTTTSGFEFLNLQGGADFQVADGFGVGPFLSFSLGQYSSVSADPGGSADITNKAMHEWLTLGVRGVFSP